MKQLFFLLLLSPVFCFGQTNGAGQNKPTVTPVVSAEQDTTKPTSSPAGTSNLAVSDEGSPATKTEKKEPMTNPIEKIKSNLTKSAVKDNSSGATNNLAVTDEGSAADKKNKSKGKNREAAGNNNQPGQGSNTTLANPK